MIQGKQKEKKSFLSSKSILPLAFVLAFVCGAVMIGLSGYSPIEAYAAMLKGCFGNLNSVAEVLLKMTPLLLAALGLTISSRAQVISIGSEGQIYLGALGAAAVGLFTGDLPMLIALPLCMIAGTILGGIWGGIAGWLKVKKDANEIIVTLMMNYVAIEIVRYLVSGPWRDPEGVEPFTAQITKGAWIPVILPRTRLHLGLVIALAAVVLFWWLLKRTTFGYQLTVCGSNPDAAQTNGINGKKMIVLSMLISGGMAGLAGAIELMGVHHRLTEEVSPNYGFTAIIIAVLGRGKPVRVMFVSFLFAMLTVGADGMRRSLGIPVSVGSILQALVLLFVLGSEFSEQRLLLRERLSLAGKGEK